MEFFFSDFVWILECFLCMQFGSQRKNMAFLQHLYPKNVNFGWFFGCAFVLLVVSFGVDVLFWWLWTGGKVMQKKITIFYITIDAKKPTYLAAFSEN